MMIDLGFLDVTDLTRAERRAVAFLAAAGARGSDLYPERLVWLENGKLGVELAHHQSDWRGLLSIDRKGVPSDLLTIGMDTLPAIAGIVHVFRDFSAPPLRLIGA